MSNRHEGVVIVVSRVRMYHSIMYVNAWLGRVGELVLMASDCMSLILWDLTNALVKCGKKEQENTLR